MRSFRQRPVGWRNESHGHSLAARGISTRYMSKRNYFAPKFAVGQSVVFNGHPYTVVKTNNEDDFVEIGNKDISPDISFSVPAGKLL